jgi:hypothetical protein
MAMPMMHGFTPERHLTSHECAIHKKPGNHKSETMQIVHLVEATVNQTLKIGVAWNIKQLVKKHKGMFDELQFGKPNSTVNTSGKVGAQILHLPPGDDSSPSGR